MCAIFCVFCALVLVDFTHKSHVSLMCDMVLIKPMQRATGLNYEYETPMRKYV